MLKAIARFCRDCLPPPLRRFVGRVGRFVEGRGMESWPSISLALQCLKERGFRPRLAIDVGAYHGEWALLFKEIYPESQVLMIEAQEDKRTVLQSVTERVGSSIDFRIALLGATAGQSVRFVEMETGSSVYEEQSPYSRRVKELSTVALDDLLGERSMDVDFIKLDVQGYELEVLRGASRTLRHAQCVLSEASLVPINSGAPLAAEVIGFMDSAGFRLLDFCSQIRRKDGVLWQTDLLFVRNDSPLLPSAELNSGNW